jgi:plasmid stabilization system protein ParE
MAKRIIWTDRADRTFTEILKFYIVRNGSKTYSRKLDEEIQSLLSVLSKQPLLGFKTEKDNYRILIRGCFKILYEIDDTLLIIHLVWDCRQNPKELNLFLNT